MKRFVLHIIPGFGGGISSLVLNLAQEMAKRDVIFDIVTFEKPSFFFEDRVKRYGGSIFVLESKSKIKKLRLLNNLLKTNKRKYELCHMHQSGLRALFLSIVLRTNGIKRIAIHSHITSKENGSSFKNIIKMFFGRFINRIICTDKCSCSKMASDYMYGKGYYLKHNVFHIPNAIIWKNIVKNISSEEKETFFKMNDIKKGTFVIGHVGYFGYQKNHQFIIDIAEKLADAHFDFVCLLVGVGEYEEKIKEEVKKRNLSKYIRFLGRSNNVGLIYSVMNLMLLPSFFEGLPTVAIEAQAAGVPSFISDTVTPEADMGLGLTTYMSLSSVDDWVEKIKNFKNKRAPSKKIRFNIMSERKFLTGESWKVYLYFLDKKLERYNLDEYAKIC